MLATLEQRRLLSGTVVTITTPDHAVTEGELITFEVQRTGDLGEALTLDVELTGTATPGVDTMIPDGSLTFAPGEDTATFSLAALPDGNAEVTENLVARVDTTVEMDVLIDRGNIEVMVDDPVGDGEQPVPNAQPEWAEFDEDLGEPDFGEGIAPFFALPFFGDWILPEDIDDDELPVNGGATLGGDIVIRLPGPDDGETTSIFIPGGSNIRIVITEAGVRWIAGVRAPEGSGGVVITTEQTV